MRWIVYLVKALKELANQSISMLPPPFAYRVFSWCPFFFVLLTYYPCRRRNLSIFLLLMVSILIFAIIIIISIKKSFRQTKFNVWLHRMNFGSIFFFYKRFLSKDLSGWMDFLFGFTCRIISCVPSSSSVAYKSKKMLEMALFVKHRTSANLVGTIYYCRQWRWRHHLTFT